MCVFSSFVLSQAWASNSFFFFFQSQLKGWCLQGRCSRVLRELCPSLAVVKANEISSYWGTDLSPTDIQEWFVTREAMVDVNPGLHLVLSFFFFFLIHYCFGLLPSIFIHYWSLHLRKTSLNFLNLNFFTSKKKNLHTFSPPKKI